MNKQRIFFGMLSLVLFWIVLMGFLPLYAGKLLYRMDSPVPVESVSRSFVTLRFTRFSRFTMKSTFINELRCQQIYPFPETVTLLARGHFSFSAALPIPDGAKGPCAYSAVITYKPFGDFGPPVNAYWTSESFNIPPRVPTHFREGRGQ